MRQKHTPILLLGILIASHTPAQASAETLTFEVATIRAADPNARGVSMGPLGPGGIKAENVRVRQLIEWAYGVHPFQISGGPDWINTQGFNIQAKGPKLSEENPFAPGMSDQRRRLLQEQVRQCLRALLAERFQLKAHHDSREMPVYALIVGTHGVKIHDSGAAEGANQSMSGRSGEMTVENGTMEMLANFLGRSLERLVQDRTGLTGRYSYKLHWTPDSSSPGKMPGEKGYDQPVLDADGPTIFAALQEQLGLKLETQKGQVETIVIDHIEKPSEN
jgi:uncharacterized protein (TIGR03435 family)